MSQLYKEFELGDYSNGEGERMFSPDYMGMRRHESHATGVRALGKTHGMGMPSVSGMKGVYYIRRASKK